MSSPLAGALMITFFAPAVMCAPALSASVKRPVDSRTMSTPRSPHGSVAGSFSLRTLISRPSMISGVVGVVDRARVGAVGRVVLEQERVERRLDEVVDGDDLDVRGSLDERLERLAADPPEAVDADPNCHRPCPPRAPAVRWARRCSMSAGPGAGARRGARGTSSVMVSSYDLVGGSAIGTERERSRWRSVASPARIERPPPLPAGAVDVRTSRVGVSRRS